MKYNVRPKKIRGLLLKTLDKETVILRKGDWKCFILNRTARYLWGLLNGKNSIKNLIDLLSQRYGIKREQAKKDIEALLMCLKKRGLVEF